MFEIGTKINLKKYGYGVIKKVDMNDKDFFYLVRFFGKGRTLVWLPKNTKFSTEQ